MRLLVIDTETTGFSPYRDYVIEVAAALYDTFDKTVLWQFSSLVHAPRLVLNPAEELNKISAGMVQVAKDFRDPWEYLVHYVKLADAIVAHNAQFDRRFIDSRLPADIPWVCSQRQIKFPLARNKKLGVLAEAHGVPVLGAHRAMRDVTTIVQLLQMVEDLDAQVWPYIKDNYGLYRIVLSTAAARATPKNGYSRWGFTYHQNRGCFEQRMPIVPDELLSAQPNRPFAIQRVDRPSERPPKPTEPAIQPAPPGAEITPAEYPTIAPMTVFNKKSDPPVTAPATPAASAPAPYRLSLRR